VEVRGVMMDDIHTADGNGIGTGTGLAVALVLAGIVLTGGAAGALGVAPATAHTPADGVAAGPAPLFAFPIDNVTAAFPIDNVTLGAAASGASDTNLGRWADGADATTRFRAQDMDPYALPRRSDGLPQDMDPY
jgi:hypothetical protein